MKQIIVLAAFIALGIFISSIVMGFKSDVQGIKDDTTQSITKISNTLTASNNVATK